MKHKIEIEYLLVSEKNIVMRRLMFKVLVLGMIANVELDSICVLEFLKR